MFYLFLLNLVICFFVFFSFFPRRYEVWLCFLIFWLSVSFGWKVVSFVGHVLFFLEMFAWAVCPLFFRFLKDAVGALHPDTANRISPGACIIIYRNIYLSIDLSINESINESINQSINQYIYKRSVIEWYWYIQKRYICFSIIIKTITGRYGTKTCWLFRNRNGAHVSWAAAWWHWRTSEPEWCSAAKAQAPSTYWHSAWC